MIINLLMLSVFLCAVDTDFYESFLMGLEEAAWIGCNTEMQETKSTLIWKHKRTIKCCQNGWPSPLLLSLSALFLSIITRKRPLNAGTLIAWSHYSLALYLARTTYKSTHTECLCVLLLHRQLHFNSCVALLLFLLSVCFCSLVVCFSSYSLTHGIYFLLLLFTLDVQALPFVFMEWLPAGMVPRTTL